MGRQANSRRLRRVVRALSTVEAAALAPPVAAQYRVRVRTLRRAVTLRLTGTASVVDCAQAHCRALGLSSTSLNDAVAWAATVHAEHPAWRPGDPVPGSP